MQGWNIFTHSVRMIFGNLNAAFRVSLVLYLVKVCAGIYFTSKFGRAVMAPQSAGELPSFPEGFWPATTVLTVISLVTGLWIAVSWHRYVLLEENSGTALPPFAGNRIWDYFWTSVLLGIVVGFAAIIPAVIASIIISGLVGAGNPILAQLLMIILIGTPAMYVFYRLCLVLPAAALGQPKKLKESWADTKPASDAIWQLVVVGIVASVLIEIPSYLNSDPSSVVNMIYTYVLGWVAMMVGISVLTTLYGIYVEGREHNHAEIFR